MISKETVIKRDENGKEATVLNRPDRYDNVDQERLTQTSLEQINTNMEFREIVQFLSSVTYLHLIPQLLRYPDQVTITKLDEDPFGQALLDRIANTPKRTRDARLAKIEDALRICVPQMRDLKYEEERGKPHLQALYEHWRPDAGWQREDQFSDGTLRLLAIMWMLLDGDTTLLLEEPELSLNEEIVDQIPTLIWKMQRVAKHKRQVFVTTHSRSMLSESGIAPEEILLLEPGTNGTTIPVHSKADVAMIKAGMTPAEVFLPKTRPITKLSQLNLFK